VEAAEGIALKAPSTFRSAFFARLGNEGVGLVVRVVAIAEDLRQATNVALAVVVGICHWEFVVGGGGVISQKAFYREEIADSNPFATAEGGGRVRFLRSLGKTRNPCGYLQAHILAASTQQTARFYSFAAKRP
jgi:hypothetical protein